MGACCNEDVSLPFIHSSGCYQDLRFSKHVHDNIHGNIILIRLPDLKQLGVAHMVYPGAVHSRFEHSLGVYWLASKAIHKLKNYQGFELGIDHFDIQTVKLAGLLHDIGHGPFSHLFEHEFLSHVHSGSKWSHEHMSVKMVDHIVDEHHIDIDSETIKQVKEMILAGSGTVRPKAISFMVADALVKANDYLNISSHIDDPAQYWKLNDTIIKTIETAPDQELRESRDLILRIHRRDLYQFCNEYSVPKDKLENFKDITAQDIVCSQKNGVIL